MIKLEGPEDQWPHSLKAMEEAKKMGAVIEMKDVRHFTHCKQYNTFSTPAWLDNCATFADVDDGIGKMIAAFKKEVKKC